MRGTAETMRNTAPVRDPADTDPVRATADAAPVRNETDAAPVQYTFDAANLRDREDLHDSLSAALPLPDWYGRNLDALFDCLTDLPPGEIHVLHPSALRENLGEYGDACLDTFRSAAGANPNLRLLLDDTPDSGMKS